MQPPDRKLPNWIEAFLYYTENTEPPYLFRKWTAIACIAAALQRKCWVEWGTALTFYPNLFIILVGPSACGKGTAMNPGLEIISEIPAIRLSAQATSLQALIRHLKDTNLTDIDMETGKQTYHSSLTIFSKEFTVFLGYHNRELMAALCDWYDCDKRWSYETISRKKEEIFGVWVNLIGATTPDLIQSSLPIESIGGGLTSRIIFIVEEKKGKLVTLPIQTANEKEMKQFLIHDLEKISMMSGRYSVTEGFVSMWDAWCRQAEENPPFHDPKFDGYVGRRRTHLMKLSMIMAAAHGRNGMCLTEDDLTMAVKTLDEVEVKMGTVFRGVGKSDIASLINKATSFFMNSVSKDIPYWQFSRHFSGDMDKLVMDRVISTLEVSKMIQVINKPGTDTIIKVLGNIKEEKDV
ncbi:MAG: DUF3987 domain-containing protein [Gammaproteobacteria bacterium]|nr:DUF3987 domain-containing protein [Gammaproteobacteria bacterium]MBU2249561.1 DUF3987 domain-containing protein [Gammaproteobacteria bacterium]MBU2296704.1 DUF3987 domain-containing protein [Gammaproteobacteria bacterium]